MIKWASNIHINVGLKHTYQLAKVTVPQSCSFAYDLWVGCVLQAFRSQPEKDFPARASDYAASDPWAKRYHAEAHHHGGGDSSHQPPRQGSRATAAAVAAQVGKGPATTLAAMNGQEEEDESEQEEDGDDMEHEEYEADGDARPAMSTMVARAVVGCPAEDNQSLQAAAASDLDPEEEEWSKWDKGEAVDEADMDEEVRDLVSDN